VPTSLGSTISEFDPAETMTSNDKMFEEEDPTVLESLAWMIADANPSNVGLPVWPDEQALHDRPHGNHAVEK
jgi:hypothetical protein